MLHKRPAGAQVYSYPALLLLRSLAGHSMGVLCLAVSSNDRCALHRCVTRELPVATSARTGSLSSLPSSWRGGCPTLAAAAPGQTCPLRQWCMPRSLIGLDLSDRLLRVLQAARIGRPGRHAGAVGPGRDGLRVVAPEHRGRHPQHLLQARTLAPSGFRVWGVRLPALGAAGASFLQAAGAAAGVSGTPRATCTVGAHPSRLQSTKLSPPATDRLSCLVWHSYGSGVMTYTEDASPSVTYLNVSTGSQAAALQASTESCTPERWLGCSAVHAHEHCTCSALSRALCRGDPALSGLAREPALPAVEPQGAHAGRLRRARSRAQGAGQAARRGPAQPA